MFSCRQKNKLFCKRENASCEMRTYKKAPFSEKEKKDIEKAIAEEYNVKNVVVLDIIRQM
jgi:hypothetical protein